MKSMSFGLAMSSSTLDEHVVETESSPQAEPESLVQGLQVGPLSASGTSMMVPLDGMVVGVGVLVLVAVGVGVRVGAVVEVIVNPSV